MVKRLDFPIIIESRHLDSYKNFWFQNTVLSTKCVKAMGQDDILNDKAQAPFDGYRFTPFTVKSKMSKLRTSPAALAAYSGFKGSESMKGTISSERPP